MKVSKFLTSCLRTAFPCQTFELVRVSPNGGYSPPIQVFEYDEAYALEDEFNKLVMIVEDKLQEDADGWGGLNRYVILARWLGAEGKKLASSPIQVRSENEASEASEPATPQGLTAQLMRHNEAITRSLVTQGEKQADLIGKLYDQVNRALDARVEGVELIEKNKSEAHVREIEMMKEAARIERGNELVKKLAPLAGMLAGKAAGRLLPGVEKASTDVKESVEAKTLSSLITNLGDDKKMKLMAALGGILDELEMATLLEVISRFEDDDEKPSGNRSNPNGPSQQENGSGGFH